MRRLIVLLSMLCCGWFAMDAIAVPHKAVVASTAVIDINHASAAQLGTIKGLGPKKALTIVNYRHDHGDFKTLNDLTHVKGIGAKTLARLEKNNPGRLVVNNGEKLG
jgi:comEA protein